MFFTGSFKPSRLLVLKIFALFLEAEMLKMEAPKEHSKIVLTLGFSAGLGGDLQTRCLQKLNIKGNIIKQV